MSEPIGSSHPEPSVGIFWSVRVGKSRVLVTDATVLSHAEAYGAALTHPRGHYDVWEAWHRLGPAGLLRYGLPAEIADSEYEDHPRGRIVYGTQTKTSILYTDQRLQIPAFPQRIMTAFSLPTKKTLVRSDSHYRS
ncbi:MAG: hypothetical protein K2Y56_06725 [Methylobacterium sp.]|uniref:hypothetical protein n=1 Tax=Methylobacterium sp. TaxID=409 RepID=UPI002600A6E2|nr:hypothetical protein [Methylobacterium sp.]MBX9931217.1 hypothetical protein [Methylobacterium sp.]